MDYLEIVLEGYFNENNRLFLENYFSREFKKAQRDEFVEADEFFSGCLKEVEKWEKGIQIRFWEREEELYFMLSNAKTGNLSYNDTGGKSIEQNNKELIEWCNNQLEVLNIQNFTVQMAQFTNGRIPYNMSYNEIVYIKQAIQNAKSNNKTSPDQQIVKQNPESNKKIITFRTSEIIEKIHSELKGFFPNKEAELLKALQGEQLSEKLLFPHNQNKFVEVFRRIKYNGLLINNDTQIRDWICANFCYIKKGFEEPQPFKESSVWDNLNKGKGEPSKKERIDIKWLDYKNPNQLSREKQNEKL